MLDSDAVSGVRRSRFSRTAPSRKGTGIGEETEISELNGYSADLVLIGSAVHTFAANPMAAIGLAVKDGKICGIGHKWADIKGFVGPDTRVIDGPDLVIAPVLADSHNHVITAVRDLYAIPLEQCTSIREIQERLRAAAEDVPAGRWLVSTRQWTPDQLIDGRLPDAADLDAAVTDRAVCLRPGAHSMVLNSVALRLVGIDRDTPDPANGTIVRDATGNPTGHLIEYPAFESVLPFIDEPSEVDLVRGLGEIHRRYNEAGIGVVRNAGLRVDELLTYQRLRGTAGLSVRTSALIRVDPAWSQAEQHDYVRSWQLSSGFGDDLLRIEGVKLFIDGAGSASAVYGDGDEAEITGHLFTNVDDLERLLRLCYGRGLRVACHAIGDAAIDVALDAHERCVRAHPMPAGSLVLEHAWMATDRQRRRVRDLGVWISTQYAHHFMQAEGSMTRVWGAERVRRSVPLKSWLDLGVTVALGSDWNVTPGTGAQPFDPMLTMRAAVTRQVVGGRVVNADEAISARQAFEVHSVSSARLSRDFAKRGPLTVGRYADFVGFAGDPLEALESGSEVRPVLTVVGGRVVFESKRVSGQ